MKLKKQYIGLLFIISFITIVAVNLITPISALGINHINDGVGYFTDDDMIIISVPNAEILKNKGENAFKLSLKQKNTYNANVRVASNWAGLLTLNNNSSLKIISAIWDFGDGTKKKGINVAHTYKKAGWYTIKVTINATSGKGSIPAFGQTFNKGVFTSERTYKVYIDNKPDLTITKATKLLDKKKNVVAMDVTVKNIGSKSSKYTYLKASYDNKKLKKYTKTVKVSALKAGKSKKVRIYFKVPYKYRNQIKSLKIDSTNRVKESNEGNNIIKFKS